MSELDKQAENKPERDEKGRLLPGNTANLAGRPKGSTLKEYVAKKFRSMTDEEKEEWIKLHKVSPELAWQMAEGRPKQSVDGGEDADGNPIPILGGVHVQTNNESSQDSPTQEEN